MKTKHFLFTAGLLLAITFTFSCSLAESNEVGSSSSGGGGNSFSYCLINGQCLSGPFTSKECGDLGGLPNNSCNGGSGSSSSNGGGGSSSSGGGQGGGGGGGSYNLGDTGPGGGIIFYYSELGFMMTDNNQVCHYLEAAATDMVGLAWATNYNIVVEGTASLIGSGRKNTAIILATDFDTPAAEACKDLTTGGKTDWFLPSNDEMKDLWNKRSSADGGFVTLMGPGYWSSTQAGGGGNANYYAASVGVGSSVKSSLELYTRCIRAF